MHNIYTTEDGLFSYSCYAWVHAHGWVDWAEWSAPSGGGSAGASAGTVSGSASAPCSPSNYGEYYLDDFGGSEGGWYDYVSDEPHSAWECVASSGNAAMAQASAEAGSLNEGSGNAQAQTTLTMY